MRELKNLNTYKYKSYTYIKIYINIINKYALDYYSKLLLF